MALTAGGCDRGWIEYQKIELGRPLPPQSLLRAPPSEANTAQGATDTKVPESFACWDHGVWPVPLSFGMHWVTAQANDEGRVLAKAYHAQAWSNYVLLTAVAVRYVMELQVPPRLLLEPTAKAVFDGIQRDLKRSRTLRNYLIKAVSEVGPSDESYSDDEPLSPLIQMAAGFNLMTFASVAGGFGGLMSSIERLPLDGIGQEGYDSTFRPIPGSSIRLQNVGQRRIRIEMNVFRLFDPLALSAYLYIPSQ